MDLKIWFIIAVEINACMQKNATNQKGATENSLALGTNGFQSFEKMW